MDHVRNSVDIREERTNCKQMPKDLEHIEEKLNPNHSINDQSTHFIDLPLCT